METILGLLALVAALGLLARKIKVPQSIVLVLAGLGLGWIPGLPKVRLSPQLFLLFLLPPLIYPSAVMVPWRDFRANLRPILSLAIGLILLTTAGVALITRAAIPGLPLASCFVLGAIVSPTDPIAAIAISQRMNVPRRIVRILEGESLVNDSTALLSYQLAAMAVVSGTFSFAHAGLAFLEMVGGGVAWGLILGWLVVQIQRRIDEPAVETTISLLTPFAAYLPAQQTGLSGVLAVVAAGLYVGWNSPLIHTAQTRLHAGPVWHMVQFVLNGVVFLLVGFELPAMIHGMRKATPAALIGEALLISGAVIFIRILWTFPSAYLPRWLLPRLRRRDPLPDWRHVGLVAWTGMRGAVSLAAALALPRLTHNGQPFPGRATIQFLTYMVILATLVVQGLTLPHLIRWLKVSGGDEIEKEEHEARVKASQAVLDRLPELKDNEPAEVIQKLKAEYSARLQQLEAPPEDQHEPAPAATAHRRLRRKALQIERRTLLDLRNRHIINDEVLRRIQHDLDLAESRLAR